MNKILVISALSAMLIFTASAQTAMQFTGEDCLGNPVDLFADLDAGKAVVLFYYMPNCGACPPPAQAIQLMGSDINSEFPDLVKGYAYPYTNTTTCADSYLWTTTNSLDHFYTAMDSGATQLAYYGGFGMPTVVLVGGLDHKVLFSTLSFTYSDTTIMRDSILAMYSRMNGINNLAAGVSSFNVFPTPAQNEITISLTMKLASHVFIELMDMNGKQVAVLLDEKIESVCKKQFDITGLPGGTYMVQLHVNNKTTVQKISVTH